MYELFKRDPVVFLLIMASFMLFSIVVVNFVVPAIQGEPKESGQTAIVQVEGKEDQKIILNTDEELPETFDIQIDPGTGEGTVISTE